MGSSPGTEGSAPATRPHVGGRECARREAGSTASGSLTIRILFVTHRYPPGGWGGVETHVEFLTRYFRGRGFDPLVLCVESRPGAPEYELREEAFEGVPVFRANRLYGDVRGLASLYEDRDAERLFRELVRRVRPDLIHFHHLSGFGLTLPGAAREMRVPSVLTLHDYWTICPRGQMFHRDEIPSETIEVKRCADCLVRTWPRLLPSGGGSLRGPEASRATADEGILESLHRWMKASLAEPHRLVAPSRFVRDRFLSLGVPAERMAVVPPGIDVERLGKVERKPSNATRFGYLGTLIPSKGAHVLLEAFGRAARPDMCLTVRGEAPPFHGDEGYLARLRGILPNADRVVRAEPYDPSELPAILSDLDVLVVPSLWPEAYGLTVREAQAAGLAVLASAIGALPEAVEDGRTGVLFRPGDVADLAAKMDLLHRDPALREALGREGRESVRPAEEGAAELERLYEQARNEVRRSPRAKARSRVPPRDPLVRSLRRLDRLRALPDEELVERIAAGLPILVGRLLAGEGSERPAGGIAEALSGILRTVSPLRAQALSAAREAAYFGGELETARREAAWLREERANLLAVGEAVREERARLIAEREQILRDRAYFEKEWETYRKESASLREERENLLRVLGEIQAERARLLEERERILRDRAYFEKERETYRQDSEWRKGVVEAQASELSALRERVDALAKQGNALGERLREAGAWAEDLERRLKASESILARLRRSRAIRLLARLRRDREFLGGPPGGSP